MINEALYKCGMILRFFLVLGIVILLPPASCLLPSAFCYKCKIGALFVVSDLSLLTGVLRAKAHTTNFSLIQSFYLLTKFYN